MALVRIANEETLEDGIFYRRSFLINSWRVLRELEHDTSIGSIIIKKRMAYYIYDTTNGYIISLIKSHQNPIIWKQKWDYLGMVEPCKKCKASGKLDWVEVISGKGSINRTGRHRLRIPISNYMKSLPHLEDGESICPDCGGSGIDDSRFLRSTIISKTELIRKTVRHHDCFSSDELPFSDLTGDDDVMYIDKCTNGNINSIPKGVGGI